MIATEHPLDIKSELFQKIMGVATKAPRLEEKPSG
jgi:hypothetical protein